MTTKWNKFTGNRGKKQAVKYRKHSSEISSQTKTSAVQRKSSRWKENERLKIAKEWRENGIFTQEQHKVEPQHLNLRLATLFYPPACLTHRSICTTTWKTRLEYRSWVTLLLRHTGRLRMRKKCTISRQGCETKTRTCRDRNASKWITRQNKAEFKD